MAEVEKLQTNIKRNFRAKHVGSNKNVGDEFYNVQKCESLKIKKNIV